MHSTLDQFYNYIADSILEFFAREGQLHAGDRYFLYLEREEDLIALNSKLCGPNIAIVSDFSYQHTTDAKVYHSSQLDFRGISLIVSSNVEVTENFLTTLRNQVAAQSDEFRSKAILILFSGKLDSLIGGSGDLTKAGMPFNFDFFSKKLKERILTSAKLSGSEKAILESCLFKMSIGLREDNASILDLAPIVTVVQQGNLNAVDCAPLGIFPQEELSSITDSKTIRTRIEENGLLFELIESIINFSDPAVELEKKFSSTGVKLIIDRIEDESWKLLDYADIMKHALKKEKDAPIKYLGPDIRSSSEGIVIWDKALHESTAGKRNRNIIVFNPFGAYPITVFFAFDSRLKGNIKVQKQHEVGIHEEKSGRFIKLTLKDEHYNSNTLNLEYDGGTTANRFKFKIWVLNTGHSFLEHFSANYSLSDKGMLVIDDQESIIFNVGSSQKIEVTVAGGDEVELGEESTSLVFTNEDEEDELYFALNYKHLELDVLVRQKLNLPTPIKGLEVWQNKRLYEDSFRYKYDKESQIFKLSFKNVEYTVRDSFRTNLLLERQILELGGHAWIQSEEGQLTPLPLKLSAGITSAYKKYFQLLAGADLLPSLAFMAPELREAAQEYVNAFLTEVEELPELQPLLDGSGSDLIRLGTVQETAGARIVKFSPLHPLMLAYQLELNSQVEKSELYDAILKKLTPLNLMPYLKWENPLDPSNASLYASKENNHSPEWLYFSNDLHFKQFGGREFIRNLVNNKIAEFIENFSFLFSHDKRAPLKINVFNMGDCLQVLQGIFDYYKDQVSKKVAIHTLRPIDLYINGSDHYVTTFEKMAHLFEKEDVEKAFDISANSKLFDFDDLLNAFRTNVHFYADGKQNNSNYAHLTFYQFGNESFKVSYRDSRQIPSGVSLDGLLSDVPSQLSDGVYITGYGSEYNHNTNSLSRIVKAYNELALVSSTKDPFKRNEVICTYIDSSIKKSLNDLYDHSQWVTFVDPHFDLSFFKDDDDVIIVHYSDQYSSASGFDAITVTRKSGQYQFLLEQILKEKNVENAKSDIRDLIDLYNAINGEWLLKLIGKKDSNMQKEKLSLPSAVRTFLAFYDHPEIIWVPLSLEEILRVSGGAGLSRSEGLFSAKNLGSKNEHCDDLLMVGVYEVNGVLKLQFMPVEVKIGNNNSAVIGHAIDQAEKTFHLLYQYLQNPELGFRQEFYKSFFAKLVIVSAAKMKFYNIWNAQNWEKIFTDYRERLMNNQFEVSRQLSSLIGNYAVISFSNSTITRSLDQDDDGVLLTLFESDGYNSLVKSVDQIKSWLLDSKHSIDTSMLLKNRLAQVESMEAEPSQVIPDKEQPPTDMEIIVEGEEIDANELINDVVEQSGQGDIGIYFGDDINSGTGVLWEPSNTAKVMHTNTGIIGTMGTGKTQFTKSVITQLSRISESNVGGKPIGILIFDYKGDYINDAFIDATGANVHKLYHLPYNPLAIDLNDDPIDLLPLHIASTLQETISNAFGLGTKQKALLKDLIMRAYEDKGIDKKRKETWTRVPPTISDVCELYLNDEGGSVDSLHAALSQLADFEIFQPVSSKTKSLFDIIDGVTVINLSGYSADIQNLVVAITLDAFYSQMQKNGHSRIKGNFRELTKMILVDEADNFLSKNFMALRKILKEGREFGVGTILSTQFLNHFSTGDNEYDQYILTWIIHRVNDVKVKDIDSLFSISDKNQKEQLVQIIKKLEKHHSVVNLGGSPPMLIEDMPFWKLMQNDK